MALRSGITTHREQDRPRSPGSLGVVLADDGTDLYLADAGGAAWLYESDTDELGLNDDEAERDAALYRFSEDIIL